MSKPTYGLNIPGYSSPSLAQQARFKRLHPNEWADHIEQKHREHSERSRHYEEYLKKYRS